jgi:uncharacterized membrane protein
MSLGFAELSLYLPGYNKFIGISLSTHITTGLIALPLGLVAIFTRKGGGVHRLSGKLSLGLMAILLISAFSLLILNGVIPLSSNYSYRKDLLRMLGILLLASVYPVIQGYRWAISHKPKLDTDVPMAFVALFTAIMAFINIPIDVIIKPFLSTNAHFLMTPVTAGVLLFFVGGASTYFFIDDLKTYSRNKVSKEDRILKHICRTMLALGALATAVTLVTLAPVLSGHNWIVWPVYVLPPAIFGIPAAYFASTLRKTAQQTQ